MSDTPTGASPAPARRPDASMTLLTEMMERPLDPGYAAEADRRRAAGLDPAAGRNPWRTALIMLLVGLVVSCAAMALRQPKAAVQDQKSALIAQIERKQREAGAQEAQLAVWSREIAQARQKALTARSQDDLAARLTAAETAAGVSTVHGPGLAVTVDDARDAGGTSADGDPRTGAEDPGRVQSGDLQLVINGLWEAGAEAVDVNGHRLTATSAVRFAGEAILVDYRPLTRPYVIHALGDPGTLRDRFTASEGGKALVQLGDEVGIQHSIAEEKDLTLKGDSVITLRSAKPVAVAIPPSAAAASATGAPTTSPTTTTTEARP